MDSGEVCGIVLVTGVVTQLILLFLLLRRRRKIQGESVVMKITTGIAFAVAMIVLLALIATWVIILVL